MNLLSAASHEAFLLLYYRIQQVSFVAQFDGKDLRCFPSIQREWGCAACESLHFPSKVLLCASNFTATAIHPTRERELEVEGLIDRRLERNCSFNSTVQRWLLMQARHRECAILPQRALLHASADEKQIRRKFGLPCLYRHCAPEASVRLI